MHNPTPTPDLTFEERRVLRLLNDHIYDEVGLHSGWSRGRIYNLAVRVSARKNEARIRERHEQR